MLVHDQHPIRITYWGEQPSSLWCQAGSQTYYKACCLSLQVIGQEMAAASSSAVEPAAAPEAAAAVAQAAAPASVAAPAQSEATLPGAVVSETAQSAQLEAAKAEEEHSEGAAAASTVSVPEVATAADAAIAAHQAFPNNASIQAAADLIEKFSRMTPIVNRGPLADPQPQLQHSANLDL